VTSTTLTTPPDIDPSAHVDASCDLGAGVQIGAYAVVGPNCIIGEGTTLMHHAVIVEGTTMGSSNTVHPFAVLGSDPQDKSFRGDDRGELFIGNDNIFREFVTIGRSNWNGPPTRIGSGGYFMNQAHIGHNVQVGDNVVMSNAASLAGHSTLGDNCVMSGFAAVHQFTDVGRGVMFQAHAAVSMHVPPFLVLAGANCATGLNAVGLRRNPQITDVDREQVKHVYRRLYRERGTQPLVQVCDELAAMQEWGWAAGEFLACVRRALNPQPPRRSGIVGGRLRSRR